MAILVELSITADRFELGSFIAEHPEISAELERIVPVGDYAIPYIWMTGPVESVDELTEALRRSEKTVEIAILDTYERREPGSRKRLYRIEWNADELDIVRGIVAAEGAILEGAGTDGEWFFRFRFPDHENVAQFYQFLTDNDFREFTIESIQELTSPSSWEEEYGLTSAQREALLLAAQRGYLSTPREATLDDLAKELGITQQAVSQRVRRATEKVVHSALNVPMRTTGNGRRRS